MVKIEVNICQDLESIEQGRFYRRNIFIISMFFEKNIQVYIYRNNSLVLYIWLEWLLRYNEKILVFQVDFNLGLDIEYFLDNQLKVFFQVYGI